MKGRHPLFREKNNPALFFLPILFFPPPYFLFRPIYVCRRKEVRDRDNKTRKRSECVCVCGCVSRLQKTSVRVQQQETSRHFRQTIKAFLGISRRGGNFFENAVLSFMLVLCFIILQALNISISIMKKDIFCIFYQINMTGVCFLIGLAQTWVIKK